jgi:hypothetical protein
MIDQSYSITDILSAVEEIQNKKKENKSKAPSDTSVKKNYSEVPKHTLELIEEAEETK